MKGKQAIIDLLQQLLEVLNHLSDSDYSQKLKIFNYTSIGQHTRHIYELIECLVNYKSGEVLCYDDRKRDTELELSLTLVISKIIQLKENLLNLPLDDFKIQVLHFLGEMGDITVDSSIQRELLFVFDHTVHHLAIIRIGIEHDFSNIALPHSFGYTPSTTRYLAKGK